jgi:hypothetical protein
MDSNESGSLIEDGIVRAGDSMIIAANDALLVRSANHPYKEHQ